MTPNPIPPTIVKASQAEQGQFGQALHAKGKHMQMRVWHDIPAGTGFDPHDFPVDIVGYIIKGIALWHINGEAITLHPGDSYYLPTGCLYGLEVLEELTVVEVLSPVLSSVRS